MRQAAVITPADFVQILAEDLTAGDLELPTFPEAVLKIQRAFRQKVVHTSEIVRIISSDPALAARIIQIANSPVVRSAGTEIVDVRKAVVQMGFKLVQSTAVNFAMRQIGRGDHLSRQAHKELKRIWSESVECAALCWVIAKHYTNVNPDEALLCGLLSVIGRLYIFMKAQELGAPVMEELGPVLEDWHPAIAKAIADSWNMPETLGAALASQSDLDPPGKDGNNMTCVLVCAKLIAQHQQIGEPLDATLYPVLVKIGIASDADVLITLDEHARHYELIRDTLRH